LATPKKKRYDNEQKIPIASFEGKDIFVTEFLYAKIQSMLESHKGHKKIADDYMKLLPFVFLNYDEIIIDKRNSRKIVSIFDNEHRRIFHIIDEQNYLVSLFVMRDVTFKRSKQYIIESVREGGVSSILSPAMPFWRHTESIELLYTHFSKNTLTQENFIVWVDEILEAKQKIKEYKILFDEAKKSNNFDREIALKKELEKLENLCSSNEKRIDSMVYELYGLSDEEIGIVDGEI